MKERKVRVFISSTFKDLNEERNYLNTIIFPQIREYCEKRFIEFTSVDLRWGITEEASRTGLVLSTCMEEIDNSRPFFIGIIGSRYGSYTEKKELNQLRGKIQQERKWLEQEIDKDTSITEIEMEYGVLRDMNLPHASFFIRDKKSPLNNQYTEEEKKDKTQHLIQLKERLLRQSKYPVTTYSNITELGETLKAQLIEMIETEFPIQAQEGAAAIIQNQRAIFERRAQTLCDHSYAWNHFNQIFSANEKKVFVYSGDAGVGTSTVMTYCCLQAEKQYGIRAIYYDVATDPSLTDQWKHVSDYLNLHANKIKEDESCLIVIDNATGFQGEDTKSFLSWLDTLGKNTRVAISMEASCNMELTLRFSRLSQAEFILVNPLTWSLKRELITRFVGLYGKEMTPSQIDAFQKLDTISTAELVVILRAIVDYGNFEDLDAYIQELTKKSYVQHKIWIIQDNCRKLFLSISKELEMKYGMALAAICASNGISESDVQSIFEISPAEWSILRPNILQFCKTNGSKIVLLNAQWDPNVGFYLWDDICKKIIKWYTAHPDTWSYAAPILANVFYNIIYAPWLNIKCFTTEIRDEIADIADELCGFAMSHDMMKQLDKHTYNRLWNRPPLLTRGMHESPKMFYGRKPSELTSKEAITYYNRLADTALGFSRNKDASWCYMQLHNLLKETNPSEAIDYQAKAYLAIGQAKKAINILNTSGYIKQSKWSLFDRPTQEDVLSYEQLRAMHVLLNAYFESQEWSGVKKLLKPLYKHIKYCFNPYWKNEIGDYQLYQETMETIASIVYITSGIERRVEYLDISTKMLSILNAYSIYFSIDSPLSYYMSHAYMIREYRRICNPKLSKQDQDSFFNLAERARIHAYYCYGEFSYQHARASLLFNFVYYKIYHDYDKRFATRLHDYVVTRNGKAVDHTDEYFYKDPSSYGRSLESGCLNNIDWLQVDSAVKDQLLKEYDFFWKIEKEIQPDWLESKLIDKRNLYRKYIH